MDREKIKAFVQNTLGCGCPEEVFQHIECESAMDYHGIRLLYKINIGRRLLVYVLPVSNLDSLRELLVSIVAIGQRERDGAGFNRFRLVLAADDGEAMRVIAEDHFKSIQKDEKIHLHVLPKSSIPEF
jgi:hypothetical protein